MNRKKLTIICMVLIFVFMLISCGQKSPADTIKASTNKLVTELEISSTLKEFNVEEGSDGLYVDCIIKYALDGFSFQAMKELCYGNFIETMFNDNPDLASLLIVFQGVSDDHVYNCLYVRDGDSYEVVDETQVQ